LSSGTPVLPIFIFDTAILNKLKDKTDKRVSFIYHQLQLLHQEFRSHGSNLLVLHGDVKDCFDQILNQYQVSAVYTNRDYEPGAIKRDRAVQKMLESKGIQFKDFKDQVIFHEDDILKADGRPYTVYTPYKRKWLEALAPENLRPFASKKFLKNLLSLKAWELAPLSDYGFDYQESVEKLGRVIKKKIIENYHDTRDLPYLEGTSKLAHHLRFGTLSVRKCVQVAWELNPTWLSELIWREFFMQILFHFPHVTKSSFKEKYDRIPWINNQKEFKKWCEGKTGFPLVDAGMRELNETGFMHNRVRMICASFLIKDLLIDWRKGEAYFAKMLLDFDLSANNGNWQWAAGSGCDAAPYFRIFNPHTQLKKFDPDLLYVKKWIPEYGTDQYPKEMIDHKFAYDRALSTYKNALK
jgi:deoxyribodipyrimidine photo-lyase